MKYIDVFSVLHGMLHIIQGFTEHLAFLFEPAHEKYIYVKFKILTMLISMLTLSNI